MGGVGGKLIAYFVAMKFHRFNMRLVTFCGTSIGRRRLVAERLRF